MQSFPALDKFKPEAIMKQLEGILSTTKDHQLKLERSSDKYIEHVQ